MPPASHEEGDAQHCGTHQPERGCAPTSATTCRGRCTRRRTYLRATGDAEVPGAVPAVSRRSGYSAGSEDAYFTPGVSTAEHASLWEHAARTIEPPACASVRMVYR
ncbi:MAG: hypothetical protein IPH35_09060 [Rhodoferax sp.]|nr:hypothetical protein [Rhodoferax sp.]